MASLAGISLGSRDTSLETALAILRSRKFGDVLSQEEKDLPGYTLKVSQSGNLVTFSVQCKDRKQSAYVANLLVKRLNAYLRAAEIEASNKRVAHLERELMSTSIVELRQILASFMADEMKKVMLASVRTDFALKVLDPAVVPDKNAFIKPKRKLIVMAGTALGGILGILIGFIRHAIRQHKKQAVHTPS